MFNLSTFLVIFILSFIFGWVKFRTLNTKNWIWEQCFAEIWNCSMNFLIAGFVGYFYFVLRLPQLLIGASFSISDFVLFAIFAMGLFGHLNVLSFNITEGIQAIFARIFNK